MHNRGSWLALGLAAIAAPGVLAQGTGNGYGPAEGVAQSMQEAQQQVAELHAAFDRVASEYIGVHQSATSVSYDIQVAFTGNADLDRHMTPGRFGDLTYSQVLSYFPTALIDDINRRIYRAYVRGYHEWEGGYYPPQRYSAYDSGWAWGRSIYEGYGGTLFTNWPATLYSLYIDAKGGIGGGAANFESAQTQIQRTKREVEEVIAVARRYRPQVEERRWRTDLWTNKAEWERIEADYDNKIRAYYSAVSAYQAAIEAECRRRVEQVVRYQRGSGTSAPIFEFLLFSAVRRGTGTGTGNGYGTGTGVGYGDVRYGGTGTGTGDGYSIPGGVRLGMGLTPPGHLTRDTEALFAWYFDQAMLNNLPDGYRQAVEGRLAKAYYRGAYENWQWGRMSYGYGGNYGRYRDYDWGRNTRWGTGTGTGDGYSWDGNRYRGRTSRRTSGSGTGDGTSGSGTGTGSGYNGGSGTGTGGGYNGGSGTGTGGGSSSGTGTGGGYRPPSSGTGTGGGYSGGSGTGTGGGYRGGSGTGTGGGGSSSGTGTGSGY